jgi:cupin 2 domain-containing protein
MIDDRPAKGCPIAEHCSTIYDRAVLGKKLQAYLDERLLMDPRNLLDDIPAALPEELVTRLLQGSSARVERIVSQGHASPPGFWYDQDENEWVIVLEGRAVVEIEGFPETFELGRGSYMNIPAHTRHRVAWTDPREKTVWLAIHYRE